MFVIIVVYIFYEKFIFKLKVYVFYEYLYVFSLRLCIVWGEFKIRNRNGKVLWFLWF